MLCCAAGMVTDAFSDFVVGHGELWCARLFASTVAQRGVPCKFMDTREVLVVTSPDGKIVDVEYENSDARLDAWAQKNGVPQVGQADMVHHALAGPTPILAVGGRASCKCRLSQCVYPHSCESLHLAFFWADTRSLTGITA